MAWAYVSPRGGRAENEQSKVVIQGGKPVRGLDAAAERRTRAGCAVRARGEI